MNNKYAQIITNESNVLSSRQQSWCLRGLQLFQHINPSYLKHRAEKKNVNAIESEMSLEGDLVIKRELQQKRPLISTSLNKVPYYTYNYKYI